MYKDKYTASARYGHHRDPPEPSSHTQSETERMEKDYEAECNALKGKGYEYVAKCYDDRCIRDNTQRLMSWYPTIYKKEGFLQLWVYYPQAHWDLWYNTKYKGSD